MKELSPMASNLLALMIGVASRMNARKTKPAILETPLEVRFSGQHRNPMRNAARKAKRAIGHRQYRKAAKAERAFERAQPATTEPASGQTQVSP